MIKLKKKKEEFKKTQNNKQKNRRKHSKTIKTDARQTFGALEH